jgi:adenosine kinase
VEVVGTQEYELPRDSFLERFTEAFGAEAAAEVAVHFPG